MAAIVDAGHPNRFGLAYIAAAPPDLPIIERQQIRILHRVSMTYPHP